MKNSKLNPRPKIIKSVKSNQAEGELKVEVGTGIEIVFENIHDLIAFCDYSK